MKKLFTVLLALMMVPCALAEGFDLSTQAQQICTQLLTGDYAAVVSQFDETMASALDETALAQTMDGLALQFGALQQVTDMQLGEAQNAAVFTLAYANGTLNLTIVLNGEAQIAGLLLQPAAQPQAVEKPLPEGVTETALKLFAGTGRELNACLITPAAARAPYVVLVHGSGPSDMDETIGPNKPFRDLAYDLAALGVGSLRFDKVTFAHPELPCETVVQEYLEPVSEALRVVRENASPSHIYLVGHSEGGMLAPWLVKECGFDGGISMAGTPQALWEVSYAQNLALISLLPEEMRADQLALVEAEKAKATQLATLADDELVFGISAAYQRSIAELDQIALVQESAKPFLFLWGESDVQVSAEAFGLWQEALGENALCSFLTYPGLNHLFTPAQKDDTILTVQTAYSRPASVPAQVSEEMAGWIFRQ